MKRIWSVASVAGLVILLCGCPNGNGAPADIIPPTISNVQVDPTNLPRFTGGEVNIFAQVNDSSGVAEVWAEVQKPDGTKQRVAMSLVGNVYQGKLTVGANTRNDGQAETYIVWVRARDTKGNQTPEPGVPSSGVFFTVPAPMTPPDKPF